MDSGSLGFRVCYNCCCHYYSVDVLTHHYSVAFLIITKMVVRVLSPLRDLYLAMKP